MTTTVFCERPIDAFYFGGTKHACIARGIFTTNDENLAAFLKTYPGVSVLSETPDKASAPINAAQYGPAPESSPTLHGGLTAGGMSGVRIKRQ